MTNANAILSLIGELFSANQGLAAEAVEKDERILSLEQRVNENQPAERLRRMIVEHRSLSCEFGKHEDCNGKALDENTCIVQCECACHAVGDER